MIDYQAFVSESIYIVLHITSDTAATDPLGWEIFYVHPFSAHTRGKIYRLRQVGGNAYATDHAICNGPQEAPTLIGFLRLGMVAANQAAAVDRAITENDATINEDAGDGMQNWILKALRRLVAGGFVAAPDADMLHTHALQWGRAFWQFGRNNARPRVVQDSLYMDWPHH